MITKELNPGFKQKYNSCVMANYGVVAHHFGCIDNVEEIFDAYCCVFNHLPFNVITEQYAGDHLNYVCKKLNWSGYQMIEFLHKNGGNDVFSKCKNAFTVEIIKQERYSEIENILKEEKTEVIANIVTKTHSLTIYALKCSTELFLYGYNTNDNTTFVITEITDKNFTVEGSQFQFSNCVLFKKNTSLSGNINR